MININYNQFRIDQLIHVTRGARYFVRKNREMFATLTRTSLTLIAIGLLIAPTALASYQPTIVGANSITTNTVEEVTVIENVSAITEMPVETIVIEKVESVYQNKLAEQAKVEAVKQAQAIAQAKVTPVSTDESIEVKRFWVKQAASAYGIDWKILEAVWQVESGKRFQTTVTSYAGAQGPCQFMPGTWRAYAKDGNGDGIKDVNFAPDCLFAAADLLGRNGGSVNDWQRALRRYNNAQWYVDKVLALAATVAD